MRLRKITVALGALVVLAGCQNVTRVTTSTGIGVGCMRHALSADGRWVAISTLVDPSGLRTDQQTIVRDVTDGTTRKVAGQPSFVPSGTAISDDGLRVALLLLGYEGETQRSRLHLYGQRSGNRVAISPEDEFVTSVAISGDGRTIVYSSPELWAHDIATGTRRALTRPSGSSGLDLRIEDVSPTGRYVAVSAEGRAWILDTSNRTAVALTVAGGTVSDPAISDDGRWAVFASVASGRHHVELWDRTTGKATRIATGTDDLVAGQPDLSGDGSTIAYTTVRWPAPITMQLKVRDRATGTLTVAATADTSIYEPSLARNGRSATFCTAENQLVAGSPQAPNVYRWTAG